MAHKKVQRVQEIYKNAVVRMYNDYKPDEGLTYTEPGQVINLSRLQFDFTKTGI